MKFIQILFLCVSVCSAQAITGTVKEPSLTVAGAYVPSVGAIISSGMLKDTTDVHGNFILSSYATEVNQTPNVHVRINLGKKIPESANKFNLSGRRISSNSTGLGIYLYKTDKPVLNPLNLHKSSAANTIYANKPGYLPFMESTELNTVSITLVRDSTKLIGLSGTVYNSIVIGNYRWTYENCNDSLHYIKGKIGRYYNDSVKYASYGRLYSSDEVAGCYRTQTYVSPCVLQGWSIPDSNQFGDLAVYIKTYIDTSALPLNQASNTWRIFMNQLQRLGIGSDYWDPKEDGFSGIYNVLVLQGKPVRDSVTVLMIDPYSKNISSVHMMNVDVMYHMTHLTQLTATRFVRPL